MEVAAFVVAVISVLISGSVTLYTYDMAKEAVLSRRMVQMPQLDAVVVRGRRWSRLELALEGPLDLDSAMIEITQGDSLAFSPDQDGVAADDPRPVRRAGTVAPLLVGGAPACWRVVLDGDWSDVAMLRIVCRAGKDSWIVARLVSIPPPQTS